MPFGRIAMVARRLRHFRKGLKQPYGGLRVTRSTLKKGKTSYSGQSRGGATDPFFKPNLTESRRGGSRAYKAGTNTRRFYEGARRGLGGKRRFGLAGSKTVPSRKLGPNVQEGYLYGKYRSGEIAGGLTRKLGPATALGGALGIWARRRRAKKKKRLR